MSVRITWFLKHVRPIWLWIKGAHPQPQILVRTSSNWCQIWPKREMWSSSIFFWVCFLIAHPEIHYRTMVAQIHWTAQLLPGFLELYYHCHSVLGSMQDESSNMSLLWQARDPSAFSQRAFLIASSTNSSTITVLLDCFEVWDWSKRIHRIKKWDYEYANTDCTVLS